MSSDYSDAIKRFSGFAGLYNQFRPSPPDHLSALLAQFAGADFPELVVDLGCGTGLSTRYWASRARHVIGIEPSPDMLREAQAQVPIPNVAYQSGFGHQTGLPDQCADIVTCCEALHWMEPQATFAEVVRLLRPGGVFAWFNTLEPILTPWEADQAYLRFQRRVHALDEERQVTRSVLRWPKAEYSQVMQSSFRHARQFQLQHVTRWGAEHLIGLANTRGDVQSLFKLGVSQTEMGLDAFAAEIHRIMGEQPRPWYWSWEGGLGLK